MDVVLCSSRSRDIERELRARHPQPHRLYVKSQPGATLGFLAQQAKTILEKADNPDQFHVYLMAGICDLTEKVRDLAWVRDYRGRMTHAKYEEVIFTESWKHAPTNFMNNLNQLIDELIELQAKPCVLTIPTISLQVWNDTRLQQHKTCHLLHHQQYPDMQENLNKSIWEINRLLIEKNIANKMFTPKIASSIMVNQGPDKPPHIHYSRFVDGVHQKQRITKSWAIQIADSIEKNRKSHARIPPPIILSHSDSDSDSEDQPAKRKRKWRSEHAV